MISEQVRSYIPKIQDFLKSQPIIRAWIFGSCSRGEEGPDSDIDILVDYDRKNRISLFKICCMAADLQQVVGRRVDLIESDSLLPFAQPSANHDKILIYEREA